MSPGLADGGVRRWLLGRAGARLCALPLEHIVEVMRPLPIDPVDGAPAFVLGLAIHRGSPTPVVDLATLLGEPAGKFDRLVAIRAGDRSVLLALAEVRGLQAIDDSALPAAPPLLRGAAGAVIAAISALDAELLFVLDAARAIPEDALQRLAALEGARP